MPEKPEPLPTDPEAPKRDSKLHKPGTGEGEYPVHPDRPNAPDTLPEKPEQLPADRPGQGVGRPGARPDNELPETPKPEPKK
jgi:hypothetical protein